MSSSTCTYFVVVHGIGEQLPHSTVLPVMECVLDVLTCETDAHRKVLTRGAILTTMKYSRNATTHDKLSVSFEEIKQRDFLGGLEIPFDIRFAEFCWADILNDGFEEAGQSVGQWIECVIGRYQFSPDKSNTALFESNIAALHSLEKVIDVANKVLVYRKKSLASLAFGKYLGDVQAYHEYPSCRKNAIRAFHSFMAKLDKQHLELYADTPHPPQAEYIIVAHSLGSVLAMESLICATSKLTYDESSFPEQDLPYASHGADDAQWVQKVSRLVTLGSPIEKCLSLWWYNYSYIREGHPSLPPLIEEDATETENEGTKRRLIEHDNFNDEQDPVGQTLTNFATTDGFSRVFAKGVDETYTRSVLPGVAHVSYWTDYKLWERIIERVFPDYDRACQTPQRSWETLKGHFAHFSVHATTFFFAPVLISLINYFAIKDALASKSVFTATFPLLLFSISGFLGAHVATVLLWWRQSLARQTALDPTSILPQERRRWKFYRHGLFAVLVIVYGISCLVVASTPFDIKPKHLQWGELAVAFVLAQLTLVVYYMIVRKRMLESLDQRVKWVAFIVFAVLITATLMALPYMLGLRQDMLSILPAWMNGNSWHMRFQLFPALLGIGLGIVLLTRIRVAFDFRIRRKSRARTKYRPAYRRS